MAKLSADVLGSFVIYTAGTAALPALDIYLASTLDPGTLADWALLRASTFFLSGVLVLGMDQALIRQPMSPGRFLFPFVAQVLALSALIWILGTFAPGLLPGHVLAAASAGLALLTGIAGLYRSVYRLAMSLVVLQAWKAVFAILTAALLVAGWPGSVIAPALIGTLVAWLSAHCVALLVAPPVPPLQNGDSTPYSSLLRVGLRFWGFALVSNALAHLDQIILNLDGARDASALYFTYSALFMPLSLFTTGFLANMVSPYLRQRRNAFRAEMRRWALSFAAGAILLTVLSALAGFALGHAIGRFADGFSGWLAGGMLGVAAMRFVYLAPSAILGAFGKPEELDRMLVVSTLAVVCTASAYLLLQRSGLPSSVAMIMAVLASLLIRNTYGCLLSFRILMSGRDLEVIS